MLLHPCELFPSPSLALSNLAPPNNWCLFVTESSITLVNLCLPSMGRPSLTNALGSMSLHFITAKISLNFLPSSSFLFSQKDSGILWKITLHFLSSLSRYDSIAFSTCFSICHTTTATDCVLKLGSYQACNSIFLTIHRSIITSRPCANTILIRISCIWFSLINSYPTHFKQWQWFESNYWIRILTSADH